MKKLFKTLTVAILALAALFACAFAVGCSDTPEESADYVFTLVYKDGTKVNGQTDGVGGTKVATQICLPGANGACFPLNFGKSPVYPDENGKISLSQKQVNEITGSATDLTVFVFHAVHVKTQGTDYEVNVNGKGNYTVTINATK